MNELVAHNLGLLENASASTLCSWLMRGLTTGAFGPLIVLDEPSIQRQLQFLFDHSSGDAQETLKAAVVQAVSEWRPEAHGLDVLRALAYLAADIRASGVIDILRVHVEAGRIRSNSPEHVHATMRAVIGVLGGFAPRLEVREAFQRLFFDDAFDARFAAQLLTGLCVCSPREYPRYLPRFLRLVNTYPDYYLVDAIIHGLVRIITLPTIVEYLPDLDSFTCFWFLKALTQGVSPPAQIRVEGERSFSLIDAQGRRFACDPPNDEDRRRVWSILVKVHPKVDVAEFLASMIARLDVSTGAGHVS